MFEILAIGGRASPPSRQGSPVFRPGLKPSAPGTAGHFQVATGRPGLKPSAPGTAGHFQVTAGRPGLKPWAAFGGPLKGALEKELLHQEKVNSSEK